MSDANQRPVIGIGVMITKGDLVLLGKRFSSHGEGEYAWPGGHLEHGESLEDCAAREVFEETGLKIKSIKFLRIYNMLDYLPKHYVDIAMTAEWESGEPRVMEPEKCSGWGWYAMDDLPSPLFKSIPSTLDAYRSGQVYYPDMISA